MAWSYELVGGAITLLIGVGPYLFAMEEIFSLN